MDLEGYITRLPLTDALQTCVDGVGPGIRTGEMLFDYVWSNERSKGFQ